MAERVQIELVVVDKTSAALGKTRVGIGKVNSSLGKTRSLAKAAGAALLAFAGVKMIKGFVNVGKEVETLQLRFKFLFGSAEEGAKAFKTLNDFAAKVPFSLGEIAAASGNLAVVSKDAKALETNLALTANVAAVAGLDFRTAGEQLQRAFSGGAAAADLFRERGVTALLGFKQGAKVSIEDTIKRFNELFGAGGKFGNAAEEMAGTFTGTMSMISDSFRKFQEAVVKNFWGELKTQFGDFDQFLKQNQQNIEIIAGSIGNMLAKSLKASGNAIKWVRENSETLTKVFAALIALKIVGYFFRAARAIQGMVIASTALVALTGPVGWGLIVSAGVAAAAAYKMTGDALDALENSMSDSVATAKKVANAFDDSGREMGIMNQYLRQSTKATEDAVVKYKFYEDQIIRVKNATKKAKQAQKDYEEEVEKSAIHSAIHKINEEWDFMTAKIDLVKGAMEIFRDTTASSIADVILEGKKLQEAIAEIGKAIVRHLIEGFIKLGIQIFVFEKIEKWLRSLKWAQADYNRELKITLALQAMLALFGGGGGIPFFQHGGRTAANQPIVVGEAGPEIFVPSGSGQIIPNNKIGGQEVSGGDDFMQPPVTVNFNIDTTDASGFDDLLLDRRSTIVGIINEAMNVRGREGVTS